MLFFVIALFVVPSYLDHHLDGISASTGFTSLYLRRTEVMISVLPAFVGYLLGVIACSMCIQLYSFLIPLTLAPIATLFFAVNMDLCPWFGNDLWCSDSARVVVENKEYISVLLVVLGQIFYSIYNYVATAPQIHEKESNMFWFPQHTGVFTGQHMLLNRNKISDDPEESQPDPTDLCGRVMICTTMYRETWDEMSNYLDSIIKVAVSEMFGNESEYDWAGKFEAHVYFDNESAYQAYTLQKTWYGWKLRWDLPGSLELPLTIHLKDNQKVKSKKRWSQVMYMESAVDSLRKQDSNECVQYILATDGDVDFDAGSIVAMLLQMLSDRGKAVGAVCARTHPVGSGPFVWYQMFDYAIGHWLQKVANHVLGSVLCAPGCFSVYRVEAVKQVLEEYRSDVEEASDFLTKDMGEDRWFTTLLVKAGWKINYCAGASDSTHCPEEFDEFWKQRRRWIPSTLANQILLLKSWKDVNKNNTNISMAFILFQVVLLFATVVSPSTCILILSGGLYYGAGIPTWLTLALSILLTLVFAAVCIRYSQETQLKLAKMLCYIFLLPMLVAVVGTASQMVLANNSHSPPLGKKFRGSVSKIFTLFSETKCPGTGHPAMCFCGSKDDIKNGTKVPDELCAFPCPGDSEEFCGGSAKPGQISVYNIHELLWIKLPVDVTTLYIAIVGGIHIVSALLHPGEIICVIHGVVYLFTLPCVYILLNVYSVCNMTDRSWGTREARSQDQDKDRMSYDIVAKLRQFWTCCQRSSSDSDEEAGEDTVEDTGLLHGTLEAESTGIEGRERSDTTDLKDIHITDPHDRHDFRRHIKKLHQDEPDIDITVPDNVEDWLGLIGLQEYKENFSRAYSEANSTEVFEELKVMTEDGMKGKLGITAKGEKKILDAKRHMEERIKNQRGVENSQPGSTGTTDTEKPDYLDPTTEQFRLDQNKEEEFKQNLLQLRNSYLLMFLVTNSVWLLLMVTLSPHANLQVLNTNPLGLVFLVTFALVLGIQFAALVFHRLSTFIQWVDYSLFAARG
ncbi:uncharacterized protein LOC144863108 [Branchiostoma floridae x Branchiostoma japonicum]